MEYFYYHWGPFLLKMDLYEQDFYHLKYLIQQVEPKKVKLDHGLYFLENEWMFEDQEKIELQIMIEKYTRFYLETYDNRWCKDILQIADKPPRVDIQGAWVNRIKANEFRPPHTHSGDLSFVIYMDIPKLIDDEPYNDKAKSNKPGSVVFNYAHSSLKSKIPSLDEVTLFPKEGTMLMFPSNLMHFTVPHKTDVERVSISGNLILS